MIQGITQNRTTMIQHYNILYATGLQWYKVLYGEYEGMQVFLPSGHPPSHHQNGHGYVRFHHLLLHDILTSWPPLAAPRPFVTEYRPNINISKIAPDLPISVPFMMIILIAVYKSYVEITPANDDTLTQVTVPVPCCPPPASVPAAHQQSSLHYERAGQRWWRMRWPSVQT